MIDIDRISKGDSVKIKYESQLSKLKRVIGHGADASKSSVSFQSEGIIYSVHSDRIVKSTVTTVGERKKWATW